MDYENHLVDPVSEEVPETYVDQRYNIGDIFFTEPHTIVLAIHCWLLGHCHHVAITIQSHFIFLT